MEPAAPASDIETSAPLRGRRPDTLTALRVVVRRELGGWFDAPIAWLAVAAALFASSAWFMNEFFLAGQLDMTPYFTRLPLVYVLFVPALTLRLWSEDLRSRTFELWMTLPLRPVEIVLGKYLAGLAVLTLFLLGTLPIVVLLCALGSPDLGRIASGYAGAFLLGALFFAVGQLVSALTSEAVLAFLGAALAAFVLVASGSERVIAVLDGLAPALAPGRRLADSFSPLPRYDEFVAGSIGVAPLVYFAATIAALLALNVFVATRDRA